MKFTSFTEMPVWQKAHRLVLEVYRLTAFFPKEEMYGLTSQVRRAALSVSGNIAEAFGRFHYLDKNRFYLNARGSLEETKNYLIVSRDLAYISAEEYAGTVRCIDSIGEELNVLVKALRLRDQEKGTARAFREPSHCDETESASESESESNE